MDPPSDAVFDGEAADAFASRVYGTSKGDVRLHVLWQDLLAQIPALREGRLRAIDIGAGMGQIACRLAQLGNDLTLCDPSAEMLARARASLEEAGVAGPVRLVQSTLQELSGRIAERFDLVLCHAVLEWLAEPREGFQALIPFLKPRGYLSLMFYNRNAALLKRILRGDLTGALADAAGGGPPGPQPRPLDPDVVRRWIAAAGLRVQSSAGIRIFHDHLPDELKTGEVLEELLRLETELRSREPFASLGQHIHLVCRRK